MKTTGKMCFSNSTEFDSWQDNNCCQCVKAVWYNEKTDTYPQYRCTIQGQIEAQSVGCGEVSERTYNATQLAKCPHKQLERKKYVKKVKESFEPKLF